MRTLSITEHDTATLETAQTSLVEAEGIRFAYRRLGAREGVPLLLLQHFSGHMDSWDPAVVNALAAVRPVIVFDNTGVGRSDGRTPDNVAQMARDALGFITAMELRGLDLLGFSLGGFIAQVLAAEYPDLIRKVMLVGTAPRGGEEHLLAVLAEARSHKDAPDTRLPLFFTPSQRSQSAGRAFLQRAGARTLDRDPESGDAITGPQAKALITWCATKDPEHSILSKIRQPALIVSGSHDTMLPHRNAYVMFEHISDAQLILYPDSGHGVMFQNAELFVDHANRFLRD